MHLCIYDVTGRLVKVLVNGDAYDSGHHEWIWSGRDESGKQVSSGVYFYRLQAGEYVETKRMTLIK